ncbi:MAG: aminotransferase class V-fold PLP-dependent enzyme, partial [Streptococcus vestibularis]|nr:aminotransferase class V-fold PLP-dependent enzyme [Streptococcus vestibularis]
MVYLDNAATSQKPIQVIDSVSEFYKYENANPHSCLLYTSPSPRD